MVSRDGGGARYAVVLDEDPLGARAVDRFRDLRDRMPALARLAGLGPGVHMSFGGETALADDTISRVIDDLKRVSVVVILVNLVLLALFMRALVAPLYLVAASVLGLLASLGLTTLVFQKVLGDEDITYYVPFAAAVLLVALGSDYNVFVAGRIWEEARHYRLREAIAVAMPAASRAVTAAGLALAASFALLAIVPLRSFREFAFVMAVGVLVDTFIVRSMLVPALTSLFGEVAWWPGRRVRARGRGRPLRARRGAGRHRDDTGPERDPRDPLRRSPSASRGTRPAQSPRASRATSPATSARPPARPSDSRPTSSSTASPSARASRTPRRASTPGPC